MILKGAVDDQPEITLQMSIYRAIGDTFQYRDQADDFKKNDRITYKIDNCKKYAGQTFRRPAGPTNKALTKTIETIVKNLPIKERNFNRVYEPIISSINIGYMEEYKEGHSGYRELEDLIRWYINEDDRKSRSVQFAVDLLTDKYDFAHIDEMSYKEQHNCYVYRNNRWDRNVPSFVIDKMTKYNDVPDFAVNGHVAQETEKKLSKHDKAHRVLINDEYMRLRTGMIIDGSGHYFDLQEGVIKNIDPHLHFFQSADVKYELIDNAREPTQFIEMLQTRYGKNWQIVRDHLAGVFLHPNILGSRPKALMLAGNTETWKSTLIEKFADLLNQKTTTSISITRLNRDNFGRMAAANKLFCYSQEEGSESLKEGQDSIKDLITARTGTERAMYTTEMIYVYRYARWILSVNKVPVIGKDDEDNSIFNRFLYIKSLPVGNQDKKWHDLFNTEREKQEILMYLLNRAHQICREPTQLKTQTLEETRQIYTELTTGDLSAFLGMTKESRLTSSFKHTGNKTTGVLHIDVWQDFCKYTGSTMSLRKFNSLLIPLKIEKARTRCIKVDDGYGNYKVSSDHDDVTSTLLLGIERKTDTKPPASSSIDGTKSTLD